MKKIAALSLIPIFMNMTLFAGILNNSIVNVRLKNSKNEATWIPYFGEKVITIIYTDYESRNFNDPLSNYTKNFKEQDYKGIGVVNLKDNPYILSNWAVRQFVKYKEKKYNTSILMDENHSLRYKWNLGECNNTSVVIVIGKDKKIKMFKKIRMKSESRALIPQIIEVIKHELKR